AHTLLKNIGVRFLAILHRGQYELIFVTCYNSVEKLEEFKNLIKKAGSVDELKGFLGKIV
ncbi:hypothetical protein, partial [Candidatus Magnetominusculus xianensis]|uniref:hypothetical protein n=1 Tax=Candidatus Magnetominusculus xianensis TaxID=1748249 RepID=UPI001F31C11D